MPTARRGFAPIILIIGLLFAALAVFVIYRGEKIQEGTRKLDSLNNTTHSTDPPKSDSKKETTNWKTYTNSEWKFSLKYPNHWLQS